MLHNSDVDWLSNMRESIDFGLMSILTFVVVLAIVGTLGRTLLFYAAALGT